MPNTSLQSLPYPASSAAANVPLDLQALAVAVESKVLQVYASSGASTSAFAAAGISPAAGMGRYITGTKRMELHDGTQWAHMPGQILGYHKRTTSTVCLGTELGVMRLNTVSLLGGYRYKVMSSSLVLIPVQGDTAKVAIRYSTSGTAGLTDTVLGSAEATVYSSFRAINTPTIAFTYAPGSNQNVSFLMSLNRTGGTSGAISLTGSSTQPVEMWVECVGPDTGDTGVDL